MTRAINNVASRRRRKRILKAVKGYVGGRSRLIKTAKNAYEKALLYSYRDRKVRKREFRRLWIIRLNAALRNLGYKYNEFINKMRNKNIILDRKVLAEIAYNNEDVFNEIVKFVMS